MFGGPWLSGGLGTGRCSRPRQGTGLTPKGTGTDTLPGAGRPRSVWAQQPALLPAVGSLRAGQRAVGAHQRDDDALPPSGVTVLVLH